MKAIEKAAASAEIKTESETGGAAAAEGGDEDEIKLEEQEPQAGKRLVVVAISKHRAIQFSLNSGKILDVRCDNIFYRCVLKCEISHIMSMKRRVLLEF